MALNDVISLIEEEVGKQAIVEYQERHPADPLMTWADVSRAKDVLGWTPSRWHRRGDSSHGAVVHG